MALERRGEVVAGLVELEMIVLVEHDRLAAIGGQRACRIDLRRDQLRIVRGTEAAQHGIDRVTADMRLFREEIQKLLAQRGGAVIAGLAPDISANVVRKLGGVDIAKEMERSLKDKR